MEPTIRLFRKCAILFTLIEGEPEVGKTSDKKDKADEAKGSLGRILSMIDIQYISEGTVHCSEKLLTLTSEIGDVCYSEIMLSAVSPSFRP
jgi:hypothetical protein